MCYAKCQNILVNVLVHLLEPLSFRLGCPSFLLSKLCFIIKFSTTWGASRDTRNLCHKFNSHGPTLRILGFRVTYPKFQGPSSGVLGVKVPCPRVPVSEFWLTGYRVQGSQVPGSRSWVPDNFSPTFSSKKKK